MAKQISLNLTINGVKKNIKSINDLETAIKDAQEELKGIEIGSEAFNKLTKDVNQAKSAVKDLKKSFEGQDLEKRVGAYAKLGEGITASFAAAQAAIALFGSKSEAVAEAAAKAQSVLTIALTARSVAQSILSVRTVATNIATLASAAAAKAATTATRTLYAVLAANPYGAILAAIGLIITAIVTLTGKTKEQINVQKQLVSVVSEEANALRRQLTILREENGLRTLKKKVIEDLVKQYPGFNALLDKENNLTKEGNDFLETRIKLYTVEAKIKSVLEILSENYKKKLIAENTTKKESITLLDKFLVLLSLGVKGANEGALALGLGLKKTRDELKKLSDESVKYEKVLDDLTKEQDELLAIIEKILEELRKKDIADKKAAENAEKLKKLENDKAAAYRKGYNELIRATDVLNKYIDASKRLEIQLRKLSSQGLDAKIIQDLKEVNDLRIEAIKGLDDASTSYLATIEKFKNVPEEDLFIKNFKKFRKALEDEFFAFGNNFDKVVQDVFGIDFESLNDQQKFVVNNLRDTYKELGNLIEESISPDLKNKLTEDRELYQRFLVAIVNDAQIARKKFDDNGNIIDVTLGNLDEARFRANEFLNLLKNDILINQEKEFIKYEQKRKQREIDFQKSIENNVKNTEEQRNTASIRISELQGQLEALTVRSLELNNVLSSEEALKKGLISQQSIDNTEKIIENFKQGVINVVEFEQGVIKVNEEVNKLSKNLTDEQFGKAVAGILSQNINIISETLLAGRTQASRDRIKFIEDLKKDTEGLERFKEDLISRGIDLSKTANEDLLSSYIEYKLKEVEVTKEAEEEKRLEIEKTLLIITLASQTLSQTLADINSTYQQSVTIELERLQIAQEKALENVVGDSEDAANKRLEIEKEFNAQKKKLEKEARVTSLRITLAQTIANAAAATVRALAELGPIVGPILAAINGVITLAQIVNIQNEIANVQSLRRGGIIKQKKAAGGMLLSGPSHENGGIPLAQYGVIAEGREAVINRQSTVNYRDLLSSVNQAGGGRPLVVNNFDDSRIIEAIAAQKQLPLRAYVLQSEITNEQAVSKRLDDLSKL
jgi:hypothetical protein